MAPAGQEGGVLLGGSRTSILGWVLAVKYYWVTCFLTLHSWKRENAIEHLGAPPRRVAPEGSSALLGLLVCLRGTAGREVFLDARFSAPASQLDEPFGRPAW